MSSRNLGARLEDQLNRRGVHLLRQVGWYPRVIGYESYGSIHKARVLARVVMRKPGHDGEGTLITELPDPAAPLSEIREATVRSLRQAQRGWRQFIGSAVPFYPVTITLGEARLETRADRSGIIDLVIRGHRLSPGVHTARIEGPASEPAETLIHVVDPAERFGVVCDIDDTVMVSHLPRPLVAFWNSFVKYTDTREAVPGMSSLLSHLEQSHPTAPIIYLSTGAWNVVPTLRSFMVRNKIPLGPMLMTDWGPTNTGWFRSGQGHKRTQLRRLLLDLPQIKWLLIGDDGQHDPIIYSELAREHTENVRAIAIRQLSPSEQVLNHLSPAPLEVYGPDSVLSAPVPQLYGVDGHELKSLLSELEQI
ncbi:MAG: DUF2183 domain-containing protein [Buchananella hordeovulneris]|nr:DUF2183 domain-containing protein [Buchananella hordeovulneris]